MRTPLLSGRLSPAPTKACICADEAGEAVRAVTSAQAAAETRLKQSRWSRERQVKTSPLGEFMGRSR